MSKSRPTTTRSSVVAATPARMSALHEMIRWTDRISVTVPEFDSLLGFFNMPTPFDQNRQLYNTMVEMYRNDRSLRVRLRSGKDRNDKLGAPDSQFMSEFRSAVKNVHPNASPAIRVDAFQHWIGYEPNKGVPAPKTKAVAASALSASVVSPSTSSVKSTASASSLSSSTPTTTASSGSSKSSSMPAAAIASPSPSVKTGPQPVVTGTKRPSESILVPTEDDIPCYAVGWLLRAASVKQSTLSFDQFCSCVRTLGLSVPRDVADAQVKYPLLEFKTIPQMNTVVLSASRVSAQLLNEEGRQFVTERVAPFLFRFFVVKTWKELEELKKSGTARQLFFVKVGVPAASSLTVHPASTNQPSLPPAPQSQPSHSMMPAMPPPPSVASPSVVSGGGSVTASSQSPSANPSASGTTFASTAASVPQPTPSSAKTAPASASQMLNLSARAVVAPPTGDFQASAARHPAQPQPQPEVHADRPSSRITHDGRRGQEERLEPPVLQSATPAIGQAARASNEMSVVYGMPPRPYHSTTHLSSAVSPSVVEYPNRHSIRNTSAARSRIDILSSSMWSGYGVPEVKLPATYFRVRTEFGLQVESPDPVSQSIDMEGNVDAPIANNCLLHCVSRDGQASRDVSIHVNIVNGQEWQIHVYHMDAVLVTVVMDGMLFWHGSSGSSRIAPHAAGAVPDARYISVIVPPRTFYVVKFTAFTVQPTGAA